ncbi:Heavy metal transport/detoxification protein [Aminomonas paucivorans DSM 12260]|uniref:Heavy metal transport/detoxification protein n=1 Tax=Aminomonas paucivorans DSM 12260 TaxID=584708 RepID=E3CWX7_9BACT|nr:heavy-metal-associated domain-containing protein [Aminomonas paucivorans]EFQ23427.1 Heavy metal transport/detoxification protein [Aminomonas paucivorans DSM 12260]
MKRVFHVPDMSCQHCVNRISAALRGMGIEAFEVDLLTRRVTLETGDPRKVLEVLDETGYPSEEIPA